MRLNRPFLALGLGALLAPPAFGDVLTANNTAADITLGHAFFDMRATNGAPGLGPRSLKSPAGIWTNGTKLIVADSGNNRVLIYNTFPTTHTAAADVVVGQPDMLSTSANQAGAPAANKLKLPRGVFSDGTKLYVTDYGNNRILIYNSIPTSNNASADVVVGQANMGAASANQGGAIAANGVDEPNCAFTQGTKLFICDSNNHRVLIFNTVPTADNASANAAVGQGDLISGLSNQGGGPTANTLNYPTSAASDGTKFFIADSENHRVLIYNTIPTANDPTADVVVGQGDMISNTINNGDGAGNAGANTLYFPNQVATDGTKLYIFDFSNNRTVIYNSIPAVNNLSADVFVGQPDQNGDLENQGGTPAANSIATSAGSTSGLFVQGGKLFTAEGQNNRVLIFNTIPTASNPAADVVVGQMAMTVAGNNAATGVVSASGFGENDGIYFDGTKLFVADYNNCRVLIYNSLPASSGAAADVVVGKPDFTTSACGVPTAQNQGAAVSVYSNGTKLFVADQGNHRVLIYNTIPTSNNAAADVVIGQQNMTSGLANQGTGTDGEKLSTPTDIHSDGTKLVIADSGNHRVMLFNTIPTVDNDSANVIVGQPTNNANSANQGGAAAANTLKNPFAALFVAGKLIVADMGNHRVLIYNTIPTADNAAADVVIGQADMTSGLSNQGGAAAANTLNNPSGLYSDGTNLLIADQSNHRVLVYNSIPTSNNASADVVIGQANMAAVTGNQGGLAAANTFSTPGDVTGSSSKIIVSDTGNYRLLIYNIAPPAAISGTPTLSGAGSASTSIAWSWTDVANEQAYRLINNSGVNVSGDLPAGTVAYTETGLSINTAYSRRIVAVSSLGNSTSSAVTAYTFSASPASLSVASGTHNSVILNWLANGNPAGTRYEVQLATINTFAATISTPIALSAGVTSPAVLVTGLPPLTTCYFRVRAYSGDSVASAGFSSTASTFTALSPTLQTVFSSVTVSNVATVVLVSSNGVGVSIPAGITYPGGATTGSVAQSASPSTLTLLASTAALAAANASLQAGQAIDLSSIREFVFYSQSGQPLTGTFSSPVTITLAYTDANNDNILDFTNPPIDVTQFQPLTLNETTNLWEVAGVATVDTTNKRISFTTTHFSLYAVGGGGGAGNLDRVRVYPNPFRPNGPDPNAGRPCSTTCVANQGVTFDNLMADVKLIIYSSDGREVDRIVTTNSGGLVRWDANNSEGRAAASGLYFAVISSPGVKAVVKRFAIAR